MNCNFNIGLCLNAYELISFKHIMTEITELVPFDTSCNNIDLHSRLQES